ncbi:MAG: SDR family NAD(P)-dependent oxidoreductase [Acidimicrobiales bacterium]
MNEAMLQDKSVIVTGGNSGIGFEAVKRIADEDPSWHIVIAGRNVDESESAARELSDMAPEARASAMKLDLGSFQSVRSFTDDLARAGLPPVAGLICNAGVMGGRGGGVSADGYEITFAVNHLGHFLLTNLLLPAMPHGSRVVVVSSNTHNPKAREGRMAASKYLGVDRLADPGNELSGPGRYTTSKLCNLLFAYELDRRLVNDDRRITVNAFDPGFVPGTGLASSQHARSSSRPGRRERVRSRMGIVSSTPAISGGALAALLLDPAWKDISGRYVQVHEQIESSTDSHNLEYARSLWDASARLTGLAPAGGSAP